MTPELEALALRAIAAGAPVPGWEPASVGSIVADGKLVYEVVWGDKAPGRRGLILLPVLSDFRWLGWVQDEVRRRGYLWAMTNIDCEGDECRLKVHKRHEAAEWTAHQSWEAAIVAMLEATL